MGRHSLLPTRSGARSKYLQFCPESRTAHLRSPCHRYLIFEISAICYVKPFGKLTLVVERDPLQTTGAFNFERDRAVITAYAGRDGAVACESLHSILVSIQFDRVRVTCCFLMVCIPTQSRVNAVVTFALDDCPLARLSDFISRRPPHGWLVLTRSGRTRRSTRFGATSSLH